MTRIHTFIITAIIFCSLAVHGQESMQDSLRKADTCYAAQDFSCSAELYESVVAAGYSSPTLYYNLGNSHFKLGNIAYSILYYEKALVLDPSDEAIIANLNIARSHQVDKIEILPEFALRTAVKSVAAWFSSDTWAYTAVGVFALFIGALSLYVFSSSSKWRKIGFFAAFILIAVFSTSAYMASWRKTKILNNRTAIIVTPSVTIKSAPDISGTDLLVVHEGMKVQTFKSVGSWTEVKLPDGSIGWMQNSDFIAI